MIPWDGPKATFFGSPKTPGKFLERLYNDDPRVEIKPAGPPYVGCLWIIMPPEDVFKLPVYQFME